MVNRISMRGADTANALDRTDRQPIAIVGIGCRLPAWLETPGELWRAFLEGVDAIREVPADRWNPSEWVDADAQAPGKMANRSGGFLDDVAGFDAGFFGISPTEARQMDPQQRLALEVACSAVEDARMAPASLAGSRTGVYFGAMWQEYSLFTGGDAEAIRAHSATGWDNSVISARIAYALGLRGPAMTVATSSSSSLVAVHLAVQSLRRGESDVALVGGVNLMLHPHTSVAMTKLGAQSPDGRCRAFDADCNGYVRGEGCGVVVLRRFSGALADGDRIYAVVHGSAVNNDGASNGLIAPNPEAQVEVLRAAWQDAGISPREAAYSEAHGTGTPLGDVIEANALGSVFGCGRSEPLRIGSAKTNFGHLEPAAGILGLIKVALAIHHGEIPPSLHFRTPNPRIDFAANELEVVTARRPWPNGPRFAGVSSFGFGGTNAHVVLGRAPSSEPAAPRRATPDPETAPDEPVCLMVSGKTERALAQNTARLADYLRGSRDSDLVDIAYSLATTRTHFGVRGVVVAWSVGEAVEGLRALGAGCGHGAVATGTVGEWGRVVFVFPGQGAQWPGMGRVLLEQNAVFRGAVQACDGALARYTGWSVLALLRGEAVEGAMPSLERVDVVQPALFAMYVGLAAVWRAWGVEPSAVVGHSQGEVAAAVVCGALSVEEGARVVALRSRAVREHAVRGAMALVERPVEEVRERIARYGESLSVAVVNTERSTVVSGDEEAVERFLVEMEGLGAFCQKVNVDYASHSAHMDVLLPGLREELSGVAAGVARVGFYSSVTGESLLGPELDADYWCRNLREPVRFDRALGRLRADGHGVFIEVSPHPVLGVALTDACGEVDESGENAGTPGVVVGSLRRERGGIDQLWRALGELHVQGYPVAWERVLAGRGARRVDVPTYAFQRQRHWLDEPKPRSATTTAGQLPAEHPWFGAMTTLAGNPGYLFAGRLSLDEHPWLADHVVSEAVLVPGAGLLDVALSAARAVGADAVAELTLLQPLVLTESSVLRLQATVGDSDSRGRRPFALYSQSDDTSELLTWRHHVTGELANHAGANAEAPFEDLRRWPVPGAQAVDLGDFYSRARVEGLAYGPAFQGLQELARRNDVFYGRVRLPESLDSTDYGLHPALLDAALHVIVAGLMESSTDSRPPLPFIWSDVELYRADCTELRVRAEIEPGEDTDRVRAILWLVDSAGTPVARVGALQLQRGGHGPHSHFEHLYRVDFEAARIAEEASGLTDTVVLGDLALGRALGAEVVSDMDALLGKLDPEEDAPERLLITIPGAAPRQTHDAQRTTTDALRSLQRWLADPRLRRTELTWITRHAVSSSPDDEVRNWVHASLWGLVRAARTEQPERVLRVVDLDSETPDPALLARVLRTRSEPEWVLRGGTALVPRARSVRAEDDALTVPSHRGWHLHVKERGRLDAFAIVRSEDEREALEPGEVRVQVRVAGVNFRDVLNALDVVPAPRLGLECAGIVREVGAGVVHVRPGDRVMGMAMGTFGDEARMDASRLVRIPDALTFAEAATIPVAFITALYAFDDLAALAPGERVLVHAAAGGVGMAAVRLARLRGTEVFATASPSKWPALRALGLDDAHICSSRDTAFEATWLRATDGRGMDVVLNALAGEFTDASLRLLPRGGRFLEIGKTDRRSPAEVAADYPGVDYRAYDVTADIAPARISAMLSELADLFARRALTPLPYSAYDVRHTPHALRHMQQARHVGKLVVTMPRALDPEGTVLITGGTGELGRALASHLVRAHGARRLVLSSRRGANTPSADSLVRELEAAGAQRVRVVACDVAERAEVAALLDDDVDPKYPLTAVFHLAGVLDDGLVQGFTGERLRRVMAPKVQGALHLDELTERLDLAAFVLFSSVAGTLGTAGQSGYAAANAALDALAARRRKRGLPGTSLAFGLWEQAGVGMTAHLGKAELGRLRRQGIGTLSLDEGLRALDLALARPEPYLMPVRLELASLQHALGDAESPAMLRALVRPRFPAHLAGAPEDEPSLHERVAARPEPQQLAMLVEVVRDEVAVVLGLPGPEAVPRDKALRSLGLDSLTMVELRNRLSKRAHVTLPATLAFDYPTVDAIAELLLRGGVPQ